MCEQVMAVSAANWIPGWSTELPQKGDWVLVISGSNILKPVEGWLAQWRVGELSAANGHAVSLGTLGDRPLFVTEIDEHVAPGMRPITLRDALLTMEDAPADLLSTGFQVWQWWLDNQFCGRCGQRTDFHPQERAKWCETCGIPWYPRLAPCVIVVIRKGGEFLLARSSRTTRHFYSLIAGFVEPGENLEEAVVREVKEETGLDVTNIRYQSSQPWPFPHQLMMGFCADYVGGDLVLQEDELADAGWYRPGDTPPIPSDATIAGKLIRVMEKEISSEGGML